jgi:aminoglycoside phosphotransferase (APT) family kinase protein
MAWTPPSLPYLKSPDLLPAPLPSERCFFESTAIFRDDTSHHRVVAVEPHFIVKYGRSVDEIEGQVLLFLEHHLDACPWVPKLYAMYRIASTGHVCLIMQRMPGEPLDQLWPTLTEIEKSDICAKLKALFTLIRHIPAPLLYGSVDKSRFRHHLFHSRDRDREICGPFDSEEQFNAAFVKRLRSDWAKMNQYSFRSDFYERNLGRTLVGHNPVFSHTDLQRKNVIVSRDPSQGLRVSLIDWEDSGWFPTYWEYFTALQCVQWDDDWSQRVDEILEPWLSEMAVMKMVYKDLIF